MKRGNVIRNLLLSLALAGAVVAAPAYAQINFNVNIAPPAPQYEIVPNVAPGYVWAPGYWGWTGDRHVWIRGRSIVQRTGYNWAPDRWEHGDKGYYRTAGHWEHDNGYRPAKMKKEKKEWKRDKRGGRGHDDNGSRGKGGGRGD